MKDTNNILTHNQWSGGEYDGNTGGMETNGILITSNDYSNIGENSFKIINNVDITRYGGIIPISATAGKTYTFTATVYTPLSAINMVMRDSQWNTQVIGIFPSNKAETYSLTLTVSQNTILYCQFNVLSDFAFVDNLILTVSE